MLGLGLIHVTRKDPWYVAKGLEKMVVVACLMFEIDFLQ